jgi:hypothetical protein
MSNTFSARLHEEMVRFHIMAEHILCEEVATIQDPDGFNSHLNVEQLNKCLTTLFDIYDAYAEKDRALPNEPEMRAYMLLLQLDTHGKFDHNHSQVCDDRHPRFPMDSLSLARRAVKKDSAAETGIAAVGVHETCRASIPPPCRHLQPFPLRLAYVVWP